MALNPHHLAVNSAFELLTATMRDPMGSEVCATTMAIAAGLIDLAFKACDSLSAKIKLAKSSPKFLRAGIKFLTCKRSPQDFVTMIDRLVQCRCDFGLHAPSSCHRTDGQLSDSGLKLVFDAVATVVQCIIIALSGLSQHKFRTGNSGDGEQPWPQGPEDLLPFGPKDSVAGLDLWVARPPNGYIIFSLAGRLATFYVPFATEIFQNSTFALARPCQHLEAIITFYTEGDSSPLARERFFKSSMDEILRFLDDLLQVNPVRYRKMIVMHGNWLKPILNPLTTILSSRPSDPLWIKARMQVNFLGSYANGKLDPKTGVPLVKFDLRQFTEPMAKFDPLEQAFYLMRDTRKLGCCNPLCPLQSEVIHLRVCSRCNLVRFCGKKCQKDAWNLAPLPHKTVCAKIYSLKEALGSAEWSLMLAPDFTYAQFQALCSKKNVNTGVVRVIANAVSTVWVSRSAVLEDFKKACFTGF